MYFENVLLFFPSFNRRLVIALVCYDNGETFVRNLYIQTTSYYTYSQYTGAINGAYTAGIR